MQHLENFTVKFAKKLSLNSQDMYLELNQFQQRQDIQAALSAYQDGQPAFPDNDYLDSQVKKYLRQIKLLTDKNQLTPAGQAVIQTGLVPQPEAGAYQLFYCDDWLSENEPSKQIIIHRERNNSQKNKQNQPENTSKINPFSFFADRHHLFPKAAKEGEEEIIEISPDCPDWVSVAPTQKAGELTLFWHWKAGLKAASYYYEGSFKVEGGRENKITTYTLDSSQQRKYDINTPLVVRLSAYLRSWDSQYGRNNTSLEAFYKLTDEIKKSGKIPLAKIKIADGADVEFTNLPLQPDSAMTASVWNKWLVADSLKADYLTPVQFDEMAKLAAMRPFFANNPVSPVQREIFMAQLKAESNTRAYWHACALADLC